MNRPRKDFIPTSLSDLNIDSLSIGSNSDRHNNNSNGARLNNFDRFKATSSSNLSYKHSNLNSSNSNHNSNNFGGSRASKLYGSQSNLSTTSSTGGRYQSVVYNKNYNVKEPKVPATGDTDKWLQAWEDTSNNNNYRAPSYHPNVQHQQQRQHSKVSNSNSQNNFNRQSVVVDPFDPFEDPWSGTSTFLYYLSSSSLLAPKAAQISFYYSLSLFHLFACVLACDLKKGSSHYTRDYIC